MDELATPGWYDDPDRYGYSRFWNGRAWTYSQPTEAVAQVRSKQEAKRRKKAPQIDSGYLTYIVLGMGLLLIATFCTGLAITEDDVSAAGVVAAVAWAFGSPLFLIGVVSRGVELGIRAWRAGEQPPGGYNPWGPST